MADQQPVQADGAGTLDLKDPEKGAYGAGETGGGKAADGIEGIDEVKVVPPEEDPKMGV